MIRVSTHKIIALAFAFTMSVAPLATAQTAPAQPESQDRAYRLRSSPDILSFFISGYSAMMNVSLPNKIQMAFGIGAGTTYRVFLWRATPISMSPSGRRESHPFRCSVRLYRFRGPMTSGPALGGVMLNQNWHLQSAPLSGSTKFSEFSVGVTGGYHCHVGKHFYIYPTAAYTYNNVYSGETTVNGTNYKTDKFSPNASLHVGWASGM